MSFIEKHKAWLLPLLGVGVAGVVWLNIRTFSAPASPAVQAPSAAGPEAAAAPTPVPAPAPAFAAPQPAGAPKGADLWSDLRAYEEPAAALTDSRELLKRGRDPLGPGEAGASPDLHPESWKGLHSPTPARTGTAAAAPSPAGPLPSLDFVMQLPDRRVAFLGGRAFLEGQTPDGIHQIRRIRERSVELSGPQGSLVLTTDLRPPGAAAPDRPEAK